MECRVALCCVLSVLVFVGARAVGMLWRLMGSFGFFPALQWLFIKGWEEKCMVTLVVCGWLS